MKKILTFDFSNFSIFRGGLLGLSTIMVMICHSWPIHFELFLKTEVARKNFSLIRLSGTFGVEMFLILSAIGLYYSYKKNKPKILDFYKKRLLRILPAAMLVAIITTGMMAKTGLKFFLSRIFMLSFFMYGDLDFWFFSMIIVLYLLFPLLYRIREKFGNISMIILLILDFLFNLYLSYKNPVFYTRCELAINRVPFFILGIIIADLAYSRKKTNSWFIFAFILMFIGVYICYTKGIFIDNDFVYRYVNGFLGVFLLFIAVYFKSIFKLEFFNKFLVWVGGYSLEIYLLYEYLLHHCDTLFPFYDQYRISYWLSVLALTITLQIILKFICNEIIKLFENKDKSKIEVK